MYIGYCFMPYLSCSLSEYCAYNVLEYWQITASGAHFTFSFRYARSFDKLRMTRRILNITDYFNSGVGVPPNRKHQADNLAKLRWEFLSVIELIAKIFGAVSRTKA